MDTPGIIKIIQDSHPELNKFIARVDPVEPLTTLNISVLDAVSHIVIGQMLSRKAAQTIINKTVKLSIEKKLPGIGSLSDSELRLCGLSRRKAKSIYLFADFYHKNRSEIENWRNLSEADLYTQVRQHWGLSDWSAAMLGIFYFGLEDIFPFGDGSIKRAIKILESINIPINPQLVAPYRSYLALYIWKFLDNNLFDA
jgi:DNA-3-methyladenine glycosylase II